MSTLRVDNIKSRTGTAVTIPASQSLDVTGDLNVTGSANLNSTGVITATSFSGSGSALTGIAATDNIITSGIVTITNTTNSTSTTTGALKVSGGVGVGLSMTVGGSLSVGGTITYEDVTNVDSVGLITARSGIQFGAAGVGGTIRANGDTTLTGVVTATKYYGDGSELTGVVSGIEVKDDGSSVGTSLTAINFSGGTVTTAASGITTVSFSAGISTAGGTASGIVTTLLLNSAQDHKLTATGVCTVTVSGGSEGDSHTLRIINSSTATVGFSTYFLFPSGSAPALPTADGAISLVSFTVNRVGAAGTQLLAGVAGNFS